jgi:hypothetical protein
LTIVFSIPVLITLNLRRPERPIRLWHMATRWAAVPKTAINKNSDSSPKKIQVGLAWQGTDVQFPSLQTGTDQCHT